MQDASLQENMGPIVDRTRENLVSTDNGIIMARHRLLRAVKAFTDKGLTACQGSTRNIRKCAPPPSFCRPTSHLRKAHGKTLIARPQVAPASV